MIVDHGSPGDISPGAGLSCRRLAILAMILAYAAISLSALLTSGYYSDDLDRSTIPGKIWLNDSNLFSEILHQSEKYVRDNGRVFPIHLAIVLSVSYFFSNLVLYKAMILILILVDLLLLGHFVRLLTRDWHLSALLMLLMPLFFQFRLYHDPILSFQGVMQFELALVLLAMIFQVKHLRSGSRSFLVLGVVSYAMTLLIYEISVPFLLLFFAIPIFLEKNRAVVHLAKRAMPYAFTAAAAMLLMIAARMLKIPGKRAYAGTAAHLDLSDFVRTLVMQVYAAVPLSYYVGNPSGLFKHDLADIVGNIHGSDVAAVVLLLTAAFMAARGVTFKGEVRTLVGVGAILVLAPAGLIALSAKYQREIGLIGRGLGYIPVYIQYFGMLLVMAGGALFTANRIANRPARVLLFSLFLALVGAISLINMQSNRLVVEKSNIELHYRREALASALRAGALRDVPDQSLIWIVDDYAYDPYPRVRSDLHGWAHGGYRWHNSSFVALYSRKRMQVVDSLKEMVALARKHRQGDPATRPSYIMRVSSYPKRYGIREGYVTLGRLETIGVGSAQQDGPLFGVEELAVFNMKETGFLPEAMSRKELWFENGRALWTKGNAPS